MGDRLIVAMDGSTSVSTAALLAPGSGGSGEWRALATRVHTDSRGQARVLLRLLDEMLDETDRGPEDITAVVAGTGPGTFTGVRIAVATARALGLALDVPVLGISTLSSLVAQAASGIAGRPQSETPQAIIPVVDARRGQVFYGVYQRAREGRYVRTEAFGVVDRDALSTVMPALPGALVVGDVSVIREHVKPGGPGLCASEVRAENLVIGQELLDEAGDGMEGARLGPWLAGLGRVKSEGLKAGEPGSPEAVKPIYVRSPDADLHITKMRDPWAETSEGR